MHMFEPVQLRNITLPNRLVRASTCEGMGDERGVPTEQMKASYLELARNNVGTIISGFAFTSQQGRSMHRHQAGIDSDDKIPAWSAIADAVRPYGTKLYVQLAHCGRQTIRRVTGMDVVAPSPVRCSYFQQKPRALREEEIISIIDEYVAAAVRVQKAGFHGVQIHCAHGYLLSQFLSPYTNRRKDRWGGSYENRFEIVRRILLGIREACGSPFSIIVKMNTADDRGFTPEDSLAFCKLVEATGVVDAIEFSYGTMEYALNIIRGELPIQLVLKYNMLYTQYAKILKQLWLKTIYPIRRRKFVPFTESYNVDAAAKIAANLSTPALVTGGIRSRTGIVDALNKGFVAVSMCRPFIAEPDFAVKLAEEENAENKCIYCNICTIMVDSPFSTRCYKFKYKPRQASAPLPLLG